MQELSELLNEPTYFTSLVIPHLDLVVEMIEKNIFRPLPILKKASGSSEGGIMDEDEVMVDVAWPHLQPVYEFFL